MKRVIIAFTMLCAFAMNINAQEIFNEVVRMQKNFEKIKLDKNKQMEERKVASFKVDAIDYMLYKAKDESTFTEHMLGEQTFAMTEFVNLYFKRLAESSNKSKKDVVMTRFRNASLNNSLFQDMDKELVLGYYNNSAKFPTPFSLDTDWVKALAEIRSKSWE